MVQKIQIRGEILLVQNSSFFVRVKGAIFKGSSVPCIRTRPLPG